MFARSNDQMSSCFTIRSFMVEMTLKFANNARSRLIGNLVLKPKNLITLNLQKFRIILELSVIWFIFVMKLPLKKGVTRVGVFLSAPGSFYFTSYIIS